MLFPSLALEVRRSLKLFKFLLYVLIFYFFFFNYRRLAEGTVFEHFFVMLLLLAAVIFLIEWFFHWQEKDNNEERSEDNEPLEKIMRDVQKEFEKTWIFTYQNHHIRIVNHYDGEELFIDGELADKKQRGRWYTWLKPYQTLKAKINNEQIVVKIGGFVRLHCTVYANKKIIFQDTVGNKLFTDNTKDKE